MNIQIGIKDSLYNLNNRMKAHTILLLIAAILALLPLVQPQLNLVTCKNPSQDNTACLQCRDHYHLYQGLCYVNILGCQNYVFGNICRKCSKGFILVNNECCDRTCMSKYYNEEHHNSNVAENKEQVLRKAQVEGLEKSIATIAKNSVKSGQNYDILNTKSQHFDKIFRYYVDLDIQGKQYTAINDYNIVTGATVFVNMAPKGEQVKNQVTITEDNIHGNKVYESGYKFIYEKYGLQLYEFDFARLTATSYGKITELKFVFTGPKVLLITAMISEESEPYILYKEETTNVEQVKSHIDNLKKVDAISKQYNFQQVFNEVLTEKSFNANEIKIVDITPLSQEEYTFIIYHLKLRIRFKVRAIYSVKTKTVTISKMQEVFSSKLQDIKEPETPTTKVVTKESLSSSVQAKEVFDHLYKIRPSFRQNLVESVKVDESPSVKKISIMTKKDNKDYRITVMKDTQSQTMQIIDEGFVTSVQPASTTVSENNDGTTTVTTNNIDSTQYEVKTVIQTLKTNSITISPSTIVSLQYTVGPNSTQYVAVLNDNNGNPSKQVTIVENKQTNTTTITDYSAVQPQANFVKPVVTQPVVIPVSDYYKPEVKDLITKLESQVEEKVTITKVNKIEKTSTTGAQKYEFLVESSKGTQIVINAIQVEGETGIDIIKMQPYVPVNSEQNIQQQVTTVKMVTEYGVKTEYTNDETVISNNQNVNVAVTSITSQKPDLIGFTVVSAQTKNYVQHQEQILIMTNGTRTVQTVGHIDQKTMRYTAVQSKDVPVDVTYPVIHQNTIPATIYPVYVKESKPLKDSETVLLDKYKIFKNKVPTTTTIESHETVEVVTFTYEVNQKKFVAVVQYDKTGKDETKILEVNPVEAVKPIKIDQSTYDGKTVTTSNNIEDIQATNKQTTTVVSKILTDYPLLKKATVSEVTLTESDYSNTYEVTYTDSTTNVDTTVTVRSDKEGKTITIDDVSSSSNSVESSIKDIEIPKVVLKQSEYTSQSVQSVISLVNTTKFSVDSIQKIVTEVAPTFTTYTLTVQSASKPYEITVIDNKGVQQIVAVHSSVDSQPASKPEQPTTVKSVDENGNNVVMTNDAQFIQTLPCVQTSVQQIKSANPQTAQWTPSAAVTVDYGTVQQVTVTLTGPKPQDFVKSIVFCNKTTNTANVVSFEPVPAPATTSTTESTQASWTTVTTPSYPSFVVPDIAVPNMIKSDKVFSSVITQIQSSNTVFSGVNPTTTSVQPLSTTTTQYTAVMEVAGKKQQVVALFDSKTKQTKIVQSNTIDQTVQPYFLTHTTTDSGSIISSNSVSQITATQPEFTQILTYTQPYLQNVDNSAIKNIQVAPSTVSGGNTQYTIQTEDTTQKKTIEVSYNQQTKSVTVTNLKVEPVEVVYPTKKPIVTVNVEQSKPEVNSYIATIQKANYPSVSNVKAVLSVEKEVTEYYEKVQTEVVNEQNQKYFVTIMTQKDKKPVVVNVQSSQAAPVTSSQVVESSDTNGNKVVDVTGWTLIQQNAVTSSSVQTVVASNTNLLTYNVVAAKTVDFGPVQQVNLVFHNPETSQVVHSVTFYNKTSNNVNVVSVQPGTPVTIKTETVSSTETGKPVPVQQQPDWTQTIAPLNPSVTIPSIAISSIMVTDKPLTSVVTQIQKSNPVFASILPTTTEIQPLSNTTTKYTVVMDTATSKNQVVVLYDNSTQTVRTLSTSQIPAKSVKTYIKESTTQAGETIFTSNDLASLTTKFNDLKFVVSQVQTVIPGIDLSKVDVTVQPKDSVNSYTFQTVQGINQVSVQLNYDIVSNKTYVTNYAVTPMSVAAEIQTEYTKQPLSVSQKVDFITLMKSSTYQQLRTVINIVSSSTTSYPLYTQTILEVETTTINYYVKFIQQKGDTTYTIVDVTPVPTKQTVVDATGETVGQDGQKVETGKDQTSIKSDNNGNTVTTSNDQKYISTHSAAVSSLATIVKTYPQYSDYTVQSLQTVNYGKIDQVTTTLSSPQTGSAPIKSISFYNRETETSQVVSVQTIETSTTEKTVSSAPHYPSVVISDSLVPQVIKTDAGFKTVLTSITKSAPEYQKAVPVSAEIQTINENITKYNVIVEVEDRREQQVYTYDKTTTTPVFFTATPIPKTIKPIITMEKTVDNHKVVISNTVEQIQTVYPQTTVAVTSLKKEFPDTKIESIMVVNETGTASVTLITQSTNKKEYIINKYNSDGTTATKVSDQVVKLSNIVVPKPVVYIPIAPAILTTIPVLQAEVIKYVNIDSTKPLDTSKIISVTESMNTNTKIYTIRTVEAKTNKVVSIEAAYNPTTGAVNVVDVSEVHPEVVKKTVNVVKDVSGVSQISTTSTEEIKVTKEFKQITDFLSKNHPKDQIEVSTPVFSVTDKYQRSMVKTIVFQQGTTTIQGTYVLDQRTQSIVELEHTTVPTPQTAVTEVISRPKTIIYTTEQISSVIQTDKTIIAIVAAITKVDNTLASLVPTYLEVTIYENTMVATVVFNTQTSDSRLMVLYNNSTGQAKVIDYSKIAKAIEGSKSVESVNELGQKVIYTDSTTSAVTKTKQYTTVLSVAEEMVPSMKNKTVKGIETTVKSTGTEYKIITVENGIISQVVLQSDNKTNAVTLVSTTETSIASEIITQTKKTEQKPEKLTLETLQQKDINDITQVVQQSHSTLFDTSSTVVSGTVQETNYVSSYELTVTTSTKTTSVVRVTKDKKTNVVTVNNVQPVPVKPVIQTSTTSKVDSYGNVATITSNIKRITATVEVQVVLKTLKKTKPQLAVLTPLSSRSVTYGDNVENTIVLGDQFKATVQVTSLYNKQTQTSTIVDTKIIEIDLRTLETEIAPVTLVQTIPISAIPVALKKFPEIKQITKTVETSTVGSLESISSEDFGTVKKYVVITSTSTGKVQNIFLYNKESQSVNFLQTLPAVPVTEQTIYQTKTNQFGEQVTTSTSVQQISTSIPEVSTMISSLQVKYNNNAPIDSTIKLVESKGNDVKEIKIVTQTAGSTTQTIFTGIVNGSNVQIVDVRVPTVTVTPIPKPVYVSGESAPSITTTQTVTSEVKKTIVEKIFSNTVMKQDFPSGQVKTIKVQETPYVSNYEVSVVNKHGETATVTLVQQPGQPLEVVNVGVINVQAQTVAAHATKTEVTVSMTTGNKETVTNDVKTIKSDVTLKHITQNIVSELPHLSGYTPSQSTVTNYESVSSTEIIFTAEGKESVRVSTLLDKKTNAVTVLNSEHVKTEEKVVVQTIPSVAIVTASKKYPEIKDIMTSVQSSTPQTPEFVSIDVKDLGEVKIYTPIVSYPNSQLPKAQFVYVFNKTSNTVSQVDKVTVPSQIVSVQYEKTTDKFGETVIKSNSIETVAVDRPEIKNVLSQIDTTYSKTISATIQSVEVTQQKYSTQYKFVATVNNQQSEITAVRENNVIKVLGVDAITPKPQEVTVTPQQPHPDSGKPVNKTGPTATLITSTFINSNVEVLKKAQIVSITSQENYLNTLYTVQTQGPNNDTKIVTVSVSPDQQPQIVQIQESVKQPVQPVTVQESKTTKQVSQVTSETVTVSTSKVEVTEHSTVYTPQIVKTIPNIVNYQPVSVKNTKSGEIDWTTLVYTSQTDTIQVTSMLNTTSSVVTVVDKKTLQSGQDQNVSTTPQIHSYSIPSAAIATAAKRLPEIAQIVKIVQGTYPKDQINNIEIEDFGTIERITAVVLTQSNKVNVNFLFNKTSGSVTLVQTVTLPLATKPLIYEESTNKYGEVTTVTNSVIELTKKVSVAQFGIDYISTKYPGVSSQPVSATKTVEYPNQVQLSYVSEDKTPVTFVVSINKKTKEVTQVSTYTQSNVITQATQTVHVSAPTQKPENISTDSVSVTKIVKFIEASPEVPVNSVQQIISAEQTTTVFGNEVVTIQAITDRNTKITTEATYNKVTGEVTVNNFNVVSQPLTVQDIKTEFNVDLVTGTKQTITNNPQVLASSDIMKNITQKVKDISVTLSNSDLISSVTVEYPDSVKVVSIYNDQPNNQSTQVVSLFNKQTSTVQILDTHSVSSTTTAPVIHREIFTTSELVSVQENNPSVSKSLTYVQTQLPTYVTQKPSTIIVESLGTVDLVSYIYETTKSKDQVVVSYNKTSGTTQIIESSPIQPNIKAFFYEETKNEGGDNVITTNNLTEIVQRVPTSSILQEYLNKNTAITSQQIQSVEATIGAPFHTYTIVHEDKGTVKQQEYIVNVETKSVKAIDTQVITADVPIITPKKPVITILTPTNEEAKPVITQMIDNPQIGLNNVESIISITKQAGSKSQTFEIQYTNSNNVVSKLVVLQDSTTNKSVVVDERKVSQDFVSKPQEVVKQTIDETTNIPTTKYPSLATFKLDSNFNDVSTYVTKAIPESTNFTIQSVRKETVGNVQQYDILMKSDHKAPLQVTIAKDTTNNNMIILENRKITDKQGKSVLDGSVKAPAVVEVSDIEKENIKVLSKLSLVKDIKEYSEVKPEQISSNEQFMQAVESVKGAYSTILNNAVIIKTLQKKSLESDSVKVFYKAKDQIYEASIQMNTITGETKLTEFIKIGSQAQAKSEVKVNSDVCYGYQLVTDISTDANIDFIANYLRHKYDLLKDSSLFEAQIITLSNGRMNYKLYFKKDSNTYKFIVYYEADYKRIIEVKGTNFAIGDKFTQVPREKQINDPYFRKLDTYIRQNRDILSSANVMHTETSDDGQNLKYRTVYNINGKTYRSIASISKDNQNVDETSLNEVIEIPVDDVSSTQTSECSTQESKLDIHDLGKNAYFTECYKYVQSKYQSQLGGSQLLGASEKSNFNTFTYVFYFVIDGTKITTLTIEYNPLSQAITVTSEPAIIDLQNKYYPVKSDAKLTSVRNWLKESNADLSSSVLVASLAKKFFFGTMYKVVFKVSTKYIAYIVYLECGSKDMKIYNTQELDSYSATGSSDVSAESSQPSAKSDLQASGSEGSTVSASEGSPKLESKLKGFARPNNSQKSTPRQN